MDDKKNLSLEEKLKQGLQQMDQQLDTDEPPLLYFETLVREERKAWHERLWKELMLLWTAALLMITGLALSFYFVPALFIIIQGTAAAVLLGYVWKEKREMVMIDK